MSRRPAQWLSKGLDQSLAHSSARFAAQLLLSGSFSMSRWVKTRNSKRKQRKRQTNSKAYCKDRILIKYLDHCPCSEMEVIFLSLSASLASLTLQTPGRRNKMLLLPWWLQEPLLKYKSAEIWRLKGLHLCWLCAAFGTSAAASAGLVSSPEDPEDSTGDRQRVAGLSMSCQGGKGDWCKKCRLGCGKSFAQRSGSCRRGFRNG